YELLWGLHLERAACECLCQRFDQAEMLLETAFARARSRRDYAAAARVAIELRMMQRDVVRAVEVAFDCLARFGIEMPRAPTREQCQAEYEAVQAQIGDRPIEALVDLPMMTDPELAALLQVLGAIFQPAAIVDDKLSFLLICRLLR